MSTRLGLRFLHAAAAITPVMVACTPDAGSAGAGGEPVAPPVTEVPSDAFPDAAGLKRSESWSLTAGGVARHVYTATKSTNHGTNDIETMSFTGFDLGDGPAELEIRSSRSLENVEIRPFSADVQPRVEGDTLRLTVSEPRQFVVLADGSFEDALVVAANPPETPPAPEDVEHYFAPGLHRLDGHLELATGDEVYIADGAVVEGAFSIRDAKDVTIRGRGVVHGGAFPHQENYRVFRGDGTENVLIEGITVSDAPGWIISFWGVNRGLTVRNVKMVGNFRYNTDGVQTGTTGLVVEDCFMQCNDDNFSLNGVCQDVVIRDNVLWNLYNGGVFMLGWATGPDFDLQRIRVEDNVIIRAGGCCEYDPKAPVSMKLFGSGRTAKDIEFRNLMIEEIVPFGRWLDLQCEKATASDVGDITFDNVQVLKTWKRAAEIRGMAPDNPAGPFVFNEVVVEGELLESPDAGGLNLINTTGVTLQGNAFEDELNHEIGGSDGVSADLGEGVGAGEGEGEVVATHQQPASVAFSDSATNLLQNPGFDSSVRGWAVYNESRCRAELGEDAGLEPGIVKISQRKSPDTGIVQDVTAILTAHGPGNYTYAASVRGTDSPVMVKATLVIEDANGTQFHPAPDVEAGVDGWSVTERSQPLTWDNLTKALLVIESGYGDTGDLLVDQAWLSR